MIVVLALLVVVVLLVSLPGWLAGPLSWLLVVYVVWRAWPAVRADLSGARRLRAAVGPGKRRGGLHL